MKPPIILVLIIFLTLSSCHNRKRAELPLQETPGALQDNSSSFEIASKRGSEDLVESLYNELVDKTPELKQFENEVDKLLNSKGDSKELFGKYNQKNRSYFNAANRHSVQIKDSVMRAKLKVLIQNSLTKYDFSVAVHNGLLQSIESKMATLNDLHTVLKISRTLPVIVKFQKDHLPETTALKAYLQQTDAPLKHAGNLSKE